MFFYTINFPDGESFYVGETTIRFLARFDEHNMKSLVVTRGLYFNTVMQIITDFPTFLIIVLQLVMSHIGTAEI